MLTKKSRSSIENAHGYFSVSTARDIIYLPKSGSDLTIQPIEPLTNVYSEYLEWIRRFDSKRWQSSSLAIFLLMVLCFDFL
jgi:hypothetical protein